ncbi:MAG: YggT family protein [Cyanobacteria bacterium J06634_6]
MTASIVAPVIMGISTFLRIYFLLLIVRILLSWFPNVDWSNPIFSTISQLTDPYLNLFRSIIPPIGGLDLSAILAIFALQIASDLVARAGSEVVALAYNYAAY